MAASFAPACPSKLETARSNSRRALFCIAPCSTSRRLPRQFLGDQLALLRQRSRSRLQSHDLLTGLTYALAQPRHLTVARFIACPEQALLAAEDLLDVRVGHRHDGELPVPDDLLLVQKLGLQPISSRHELGVPGLQDRLL